MIVAADEADEGASALSQRGARPGGEVGPIFTPRDFLDDDTPAESLFTPRSRERVLTHRDREGEDAELEGAMSGLSLGALSKGPSPSKKKAKGDKAAKAKGEKTAKGDKTAKGEKSATARGKEKAVEAATAATAGASSEEPLAAAGASEEAPSDGPSKEKGKKGKKEKKDKAPKARKEWSFVLDVQTADGTVVHSMGTVLKAKAMEKPVWAGLIVPALDAYANAAFESQEAFNTAVSDNLGKTERVRVSVDGTLLETSQKETKISSLLKPESQAYQFTRIVIALPLLGEQAPLAKKPIDADTAHFHVDLRSLDGVILTSLECVVPKSSFNKVLTKAVVVPALKHYFKLCPDAPRVAYDAIQIEVDGVVTPGDDKAISYVKAANLPVPVKLTLPTTLLGGTEGGAPATADEEGASAKKDKGKKGKKGKKEKVAKDVPLPMGPSKFVIDLQTDTGDVISSFGTELSAKFLNMPITESIVKPLLTDWCNKNQLKMPVDPSAIRIIVNGQPVEGAPKCSTFVRPDADVVGVVLMLPASFKLPGAGDGPLRAADFHVIMRFTSGELAEFDVKLNERWLGEPILKSIVKTALKTAKQGGLAPERVGVTIDSELIELRDLEKRPSSYFVKRARLGPTLVELALPDYDITQSPAPPSFFGALVAGAKHAVSLFNPFSHASHPKGSTALALLEPAQFQVNIHGGLKRWETETELVHKWLNKSLRDGLVAPALKAYFRDDIGSVPVNADDEGLKVEVNHKAISTADLSKHSETFVDRRSNTPTRIDITLPTRQYTLKRISKA